MNHHTEYHNTTWGVAPPYVGLLAILIFGGLLFLVGMYFAKIEREGSIKKQKEALEKYQELILILKDKPLSRTERIVCKQQLEHWWNKMSKDDQYESQSQY